MVMCLVLGYVFVEERLRSVCWREARDGTAALRTRSTTVQSACASAKISVPVCSNFNRLQ